MVFFKNSNKQLITSNNTDTTIIAKGTKINGNIETSCNLHIDGSFEGDITSTGLIIIGISGNIKADIIAEKIIISGKVNGNIKTKVLEITPEGSLVGNITSEEFIIEKDGVFEGESQHHKFEVPNLKNKTKSSQIGEKEKKQKDNIKKDIKK